MQAGSPMVISDFPTKVEAYLRVAADTVRAVDNISTRIDSVGDAEHRVPVSVNQSEPGNSWVCSPHTAYARYSIEELARLRRPLLTKPLAAACRLLGGYFWRSGLDDAVAINNWLLSTNLYPEFHARAVPGWLSEALDRWPGRAIWFRSLNPRYTSEWLGQLSDMGFKLIPSRQVYLYDEINISSRSPANLRRDLRLLKNSSAPRGDAASWSVRDFERAAELYALLYLEKYSELNPTYTAAFLQAWHAAGLLDLSGFRDEEGSLQAVLGIFAVGATMTVPVVGYDTRQPVKAGLYRLLMAAVYERAAQNQCRINLSAGAAQFKRLRGGVGTLEYSAVYDRHLPRGRRRAVSLLSGLTRAVGVPLMRRLEL
jgi:hypothetical protein